jgi:hypothetical protein
VDIAATADIAGVWRRGVRLDREARRLATAPSAVAPLTAALTPAATTAAPAPRELDPTTAAARWYAAERTRESARPDRLIDPHAMAVTLRHAFDGAIAELERDPDFDAPDTHERSTVRRKLPLQATQRCRDARCGQAAGMAPYGAVISSMLWPSGSLKYTPRPPSLWLISPEC